MVQILETDADAVGILTSYTGKAACHHFSAVPVLDDVLPGGVVGSALTVKFLLKHLLCSLFNVDDKDSLAHRLHLCYLVHLLVCQYVHSAMT